MDINQLKYLITVVEAQTFTNASDILHVSQPSLSIAIKKLENHLGLMLLDRSKRKLSLTKEGRILYLEAKRLMNQLDYIEDEMERLKKEGPLELSIGTIESANHWLPKVLKIIKESYEDVHIQLLDILSLDEVKNALLNYRIHFAITNQYINTDEIKSTFLYEEHLVVLMPNDHPMRNKERLSIVDLNNEPFILCKEGFQTRDDIKNAFRRSSSKLNIHYEIERFETACRLVEEGLGITIIPEKYVNRASNNRFCVRYVSDQDIKRNVYLVVDKKRYLPPIVIKFMEQIFEYHK
ncbi:LysR family transcriptional regulator [Oceanobacillus sp. FSL K6-2867]|uniref:LysR family transcriptional regulator n=1 Tax=Oceanobacillus sp. FSL K6-2867 TaxID=2954748 RepID=UPI0030DDD421